MQSLAASWVDFRIPGAQQVLVEQDGHVVELARHDIVEGFLVGARARIDQDVSVSVLDFHHEIDGILATSVQGEFTDHRANGLKELGSIFHPLPCANYHSCTIFGLLLPRRKQRPFATSRSPHPGAISSEGFLSLGIRQNEMLPVITTEAGFISFHALGLQVAPIDRAPIDIGIPVIRE